jgi:ribosome-binding factor A
MSRDRPQRVAQLIQEELGRLSVRGFKDPRIGFVTFTGVKVSPDLRYATAFYSVMGDDQAKAETAKGLKAAAGYIRRELGQVLQMRYTPEVRFEFDEAIERGDRIERLLREVKAQEGGGGTPPAGGEG